MTTLSGILDFKLYDTAWLDTIDEGLVPIYVLKHVDRGEGLELIYQRIYDKPEGLETWADVAWDDKARRKHRARRATGMEMGPIDKIRWAAQRDDYYD